MSAYTVISNTFLQNEEKMRGLYTKKDGLIDWSAGSDVSEKYAGLGIGKMFGAGIGKMFGDGDWQNVRGWDRQNLLDRVCFMETIYRVFFLCF